MDIEGIGDSTVDILVEQWLVKNVADIYTLVDPQIQFQLRSFPWFAGKKVFEIIKQIEESKKQPLWRLINGLGISGVGKKTAIDLVKAVDAAQAIHTLEDLTIATDNEEFLRGIYGIGEKIVEWIIGFFKHNTSLLQRLETYGLNFDSSKIYWMNAWYGQRKRFLFYHLNFPRQ